MLVYKITNNINNKCYIGSTSDFERRKYEHIISSTSDKYKSYNYPLQRAFRKYGIDNFSFDIIEDNIEMKDIADKEYSYIIKFNSLSNNEGYNQTLYTDCALRDPDYIKNYIEKHGSKCAKVDNKNNIIAIYNSLHEAARQLSLLGLESKIKTVCEGKQYSLKNHIFRYIVDDVVIIPQQLTRPRCKQICGISIYNKNDIIYYKSVSEAARAENVERSSISKCIAGNVRYSHVNSRIWRAYDNNCILENDINIDDIIFKYSGYCIIDYNANRVYKALTLKELSEQTNIRWAVIQRNMKLNRRIKNIGYYKLDIYGEPIIKEVI